jgi:hypothetical protein
LLPALPKMAWALWLDGEHRAAKMHLAFEVLCGIPVGVTVTAGNAPEHDQLRAAPQAGRLYVIDRGYAEYQLFQDIIDAHSSFIGRLRDNAVWRVVEERPVSAAARAAGVVRDVVVWLGGGQSGQVFQRPLRVIAVRAGAADAPGRPEVLLLATDRLDLEAEPVALGYILYAATSDTSPKVWKLCVRRASIASLCLVGRSSRHRWMAVVNSS